jgi:hypothetical protein
MTTGTLLGMLTADATEYRLIARESIKSNNHTHHASGKYLYKDDIDALLVDFINFVASRSGVDYGLKVDDFYPLEATRG